MSRFAPALRRVAAELDLPRGVRAAIVLEMAADLEAVYEHHRLQGMPEADAAIRAEEMVLGSAEVVRRLGRLHRESWRGWSETLATRLSAGGADLLLMILAVVPVVLFAGAVAAGIRLPSSGPLLWPLLALGLALSLVSALEAGRLLGGGRGARSGLATLPVLAAAAPALGLLGFALQAYSAVRQLSAGALDAAAQVELVVVVGNGAALLLIGLLLGLTGAVAWFILLHGAAARAAREVDALLAEKRPPPPAASAPEVLPLVRRQRG